MRAVLERLSGPLHALLAFSATWLIFTSPWISMVTRLKADAGFLNWAHLLLGCAALPVVLLYTLHCALGGRWRLYFPWLAGDFAAARRDLGGLLAGRLPASEGGGLFALIEGLLLLAMLAAAITGVAWLATQGSPAAGDWHDRHTSAAWMFGALALAHALSVSVHLLDFIRD